MPGELLAAGDRRYDRQWEPGESDTARCPWSDAVGKPVPADDTSYPRSSRGGERSAPHGASGQYAALTMSVLYVPFSPVPRLRLQLGDQRGLAERNVTMTLIEPGLSIREGSARGPRADAALRPAARAGRLPDELQEQAPAGTTASHRALKGTRKAKAATI
ncbi:hypothetical protein GCM10010326_76300 [Streptomyces xanthochromogenes]|uniref:Uncharacterized protein n=1 Tax=Streptomyces xanthochromogenes TaxID=67384 RepID=A0ABQ3AYV8_9ACTN|nr:hypothetical protein GCM10010326_76300 [Streptomyces xanthochromogenes]